MTKLGRNLMALLAVGALLLAACGGDDDDAGDGSTIEDAADDKSPSKLADVSAKCIAAAAAIAGAQVGALAGTDLTSSVKDLEAIADEAPKSIREDLDVIADAYLAVSKALKDTGYNPAKPPTTPAEQARYAAALATVGEQFDDKKFTAASDRVEAWFDDECGN